MDVQVGIPQYSIDLPQGGLEIPCIFFKSKSIVVTEVDVDSPKDVWVSANKNTLLMTDKEVLLMYGSSLTDMHINYAQALLKQQFTRVGELQSTLFQYKSLQNIS